MDMNKFMGKDKPDAEKIPGFKLYFNESLGKWAYRPEVGYSEKYITEDTFIPKQEECSSVETYVDGRGKNLKKARAVKNDEFYTRFEDISAELKHYKEFFKDKVVYCPCDKVFNNGRSEFFNFFIRVFNDWGIKKLVATQYCPNGDKRGYLWVVENFDKLGFNVDESDVDTYLLDGDGSFCSDECRQIMSESDIIVTNPPFTRFRDFVGQIMELEKQFLIIGNKNALTYKEIYPLIKENKIWLGYTSPQDFEQPSTHEEKKLTGLTRWFTNLPHKKRFSEKIDIWKEYSPDKYFMYDNYEGAIECGHFLSDNHSTFLRNWEGSVDDIPDYDGVMGVPITFLDVYNPNQFDIVGFRKGTDGKDLRFMGYSPYFRVLIKRKD